MTDIVLYTKPLCVNCKAVKWLLDQNKLDYKEIKIPLDMELAIFMEKFPYVKSVPAMTIDDQFIGGLGQFKDWLKSTGKEDMPKEKINQNLDNFQL